jgi:tetratricopeptide (TPR) repeat protein
MQTNFLNFLKNIFFILFFLFEVHQSHAQVSLLHQADSLYNQKNYGLSEKSYVEVLQKNIVINPNIYLKLANMNEAKGDYPNALYYLNLYYLKKPSDALFTKMANLANERNYKGYEKNDLNFIVLLYRQYFLFLLMALMILGVYIFSILIYKRIKNQHTPLRHKFIALIYITFLLTLINLPDNYIAIIIKNNNVLLRDYPSAAAEITGKIDEGHRLNVVSVDDIWYQVFWDEKFSYVKKSDILVIE